MSESRRNTELNNGWILCPSKSFPGKFYYFNVRNGETAWSLNQAENKGFKKEGSFHKIADKSHRYPEPTTLPDDSTITSHNIYTSIKNPDFHENIPSTSQPPTFGQATFPKYVTNVEPFIPNIVWTPVPFPMFCPGTRNPMFDKITQISDYERELFVQSSSIPLSKRFTNYEKPCLSFDRRNKIIKPTKFETSTPKNSFLECISEPQSLFPKSLIKDPVLKVEPKLRTSKNPDITKSNEKSVISLSSKVESTKCSTGVQVDEKENALEKLDSTDLRFLLLAKRKSFGAVDTELERKKPKTSEVKAPTPKKRVTFNVKDETDEDDSTINDEAPDDFIVTPNPTWTNKEAPKSPLVLKDKIPPSFIKQTETPSNVKSQTQTIELPTFRTYTTRQLPTFQQSTTKQLSTFQPSTTNQLPTFQPSTTKQLPTFQPSTTKQLPTFQPSPIKHQTTFQPSTTNQLPTFQPSTTKQQTTFQPSTSKELPTFQQSATNPPTLQPTATNQQPTVKSTNWYIVVDTDVLLLDYEFIEKLVLSDQKCRLVIPHVVASDIEALCLGDCRGQQRVISARQLTRKLAAPPPYCILEPRTSENGSLVTESILNCCLKAAKKKYYVVLITNDPHLQIRATLLNIPTYKLNDIKYGSDINPNTTTQQKNTKVTNTANTAKDNTNNMFDKNISLFSNFKITPEKTSMEKVVKINDKKQLDSYRSPRKQLFLSSESETDASSDFDNLVNKTTKPKTIEDTENGAKSESDGTSEISSVVSSLQLKDKNILKPQNVGQNPSIPQNDSRKPFPQQNVDKNPFLTQNVKENEFGSFEKRILNPTVVFNKHSIATISNETPTEQRKNYINDFLDYNFENQEKSFTPIPLTHMKSNLENSAVPNTCLSLRQESYVVNREPKLLNPSKTRIIKLMNNLSTDSNALNTKPKETAPVFKIPKPLPIKGTKNKSIRLERSPQNDRILTRSSKDNIDQSVKRFFIKNKSMRAKVCTRIDEWICCYMQIMEDVLANILQQNSVCMENTVAPLTFKDTLNCVKMLYDGYTKVRDIINRLSEVLEKCMVGVQGQFKMPVPPEDFMKILGYGVLLVQELKNILPLDEDLKEAKIRLNTLHMNLQNNTKEVDPELVKSPSVSRIEKDEEEIRPQFVKKTSYVIDYLKKHFKEWEAYKEDLDEQNHKIENHTDFKVVRTLGKNLNLLKIDKKKNMSLSNITKDDDVLDKKLEPKIIRMLENNINTENIETYETKLMRLVKNEKKRNEFNFRSEDNLNGTDCEEKDLQLNKNTVNLEQDKNFDSKDDEFNYTTHENTILDENTGKDQPKIVRNIKAIDEFEDKLKRRVSLDLDLLDYSDIYEPSIDKNIDFDVISEKNYKNEKHNIFEIGLDFGLDNSRFTLEDFYITPTISPESVKNLKNLESQTNTENHTVKESENSENITDFYLSSVSENKNVTNSNIENKTHNKNNSEVESETYTEKGSNNDSCIGNGNSEKHLDNSEKPFDDSEKHFVKSETLNYDSGTHLDNSESHNDIFGKTAHVLDDSTNDSGFENDSTYAHSVVKVFLKEICTTFQAIYAFVTKFLEEIREPGLSDKRKDTVHNLASRALEDMVAIINHLKSIIKRESAEDTVLKTLLRNAGVEATTDRRIMRYRQIVIKCLEQALILESALKIMVSTTIGDFDAISANAETIASNIRYFNIFETDYQPFVGNSSI